MIKSQLPVPEQAPPQPVNIEFADASAERETSVPRSTGAEHTSGQRNWPNPTFPEPFPASVMLSTGNGCVVLSIMLTVLPDPFVMIKSGKLSPLISAAAIEVASFGLELK